MVPIIESDYIILLGIVFYTRNIILLGLTTKNKHYSAVHHVGELPVGTMDAWGQPQAERGKYFGFIITMHKPD